MDSHFLCPCSRGDLWLLLSFFWDSAQDTLALWKKHTPKPWMSHRLCPELKCDEEGRLVPPQPVKWFPLQCFCLEQQFCPLILLPMTTEPSGQGTGRLASAYYWLVLWLWVSHSYLWVLGPIWTKSFGPFLLQLKVSLLSQRIPFSTEQTISERLWVPYIWRYLCHVLHSFSTGNAAEWPRTWTLY